MSKFNENYLISKSSENLYIYAKHALYYLLPDCMIICFHKMIDDLPFIVFRYHVPNAIIC